MKKVLLVIATVALFSVTACSAMLADEFLRIFPDHSPNKTQQELSKKISCREFIGACWIMLNSLDSNPTFFVTRGGSDGTSGGTGKLMEYLLCIRGNLSRIIQSTCKTDEYDGERFYTIDEEAKQMLDELNGLITKVEAKIALLLAE